MRNTVLGIMLCFIGGFVLGYTNITIWSVVGSVLLFWAGFLLLSF